MSRRWDERPPSPPPSSPGENCGTPVSAAGRASCEESDGIKHESTIRFSTIQSVILLVSMHRCRQSVMHDFKLFKLSEQTQRRQIGFVSTRSERRNCWASNPFKTSSKLCDFKDPIAR